MKQDTVQKVVIEPEEITYLVQEMTKRHQEDGEADFHTAMAILAHRYNADPERAFCVHIRVVCLVTLIAANDPRMRGWSIETAEPGCRMTHQAAFEAAAVCPLRREGDRYFFDADDFFRIALERCDPETSA